jgi:hypothetical protein
MRRKLLAFGAALSAGAVAAWSPRAQVRREVTDLRELNKTLKLALD